MLNQKPPFRVLTLDGGGIRGLYTATVLRTIVAHFTERRNVAALDVGRGFDLIAGTSTGGILACALASGICIDEIIRFYREEGPKIFRNPIPDRSFKLVYWSTRHLSRPANHNGALRNALKQVFGNQTLGSVYRDRGVALCIPCVNMATNKSWIYKTPHLPYLKRDAPFQLVDVCLATSAAPIFLPLAGISNPSDHNHQLIFADGGLWANNPVLIGLIEALNMTDSDRPIHVLSIGTCPPPRGEVISEDAIQWGLLKWRIGVDVLATSLEAQSWGYYFMAQMLAESLQRLNRPCKVVRLRSSAPSLSHMKHLALDRATPKSLQVLADLGREDGDIEHIRSNDPEGAFSMLEDLFLKMPAL